MDILCFCPLWGCESIPFDVFLDNASAANYDGVEMSLPEAYERADDIAGVVRAKGLKLILQHWQPPEPDFKKNRERYEKSLRGLVRAKPLFINSQTGADYFSYEQNCELIELAGAISRESGVVILHETHRGKFSFAPHITRKFLEGDERLRLSLDISHWCCVSESLLEDQADAVSLAISRSDHIHARVGFMEGPQIPDPRAAEWKEVVDRHLGWWDRIIERAKTESRDYFTITSEFGPYPYMTVLPHSEQPIADQWAVNCYMKDLLRDRYCQ